MPKKVVLKITKGEYRKRLAVLRKKANRSIKALSLQIVLRRVK